MGLSTATLLSYPLFQNLKQMTVTQSMKLTAHFLTKHQAQEFLWTLKSEFNQSFTVFEPRADLTALCRLEAVC